MEQRKSSLAFLNLARHRWNNFAPLDRYHLAWWAAFRAVLLSLALAVPLAFFIVAMAEPPALESLIRSFLLIECRPEPEEQLGYALFLLLLIPSFLLFLANSLRTPFDPMRAETLTYRSQLFLIVLFLFTSLRRLEWWQFFPHSTWLIVASSLALRFRSSILRFFRTPVFRRIPQSGALATGGALVLTTLLLIHSIFTEAALDASVSAIRYHFSFFIDEMAAIVSGKTILVDFLPQYSRVLPYLLEPIFRKFGISILGYSVTMALLNGIALYCAWVIIRRATASPGRSLIYFAALAGLFAYQQAGEKHFSNFSYHAVGPFRTFFPMISLVALSSALRNPSHARVCVASLLSATALVNNPDFGLPTWVAVTASLTLFGSHPARNLFIGVVGLVSMAGAFVGLTWLRSGELPDLTIALEFQRLFAWTGFYMMRLPAVGIYQWVFAVCFGGMILSLTRRLLGSPQTHQHQNGMLLATGLMGMGCLSYYIGRSYWSVTTAAFWIFSICLVFVIKEIFSLPVTRTTRFPALASTLFMLGGASVLPVGLDLKDKLEDLRRSGGEISRRLDATTREVLARSPSQPVALIFPFGQLVAASSGVTNVSPFAEEGSIISHAQFQRLWQSIENHCVTLVAFQTPADDLLKQLEASGFERASVVEGISFWQRPRRRLNATCIAGAAGG